MVTPPSKESVLPLVQNVYVGPKCDIKDLGEVICRNIFPMLRILSIENECSTCHIKDCPNLERINIEEIDFSITTNTPSIYRFSELPRFRVLRIDRWEPHNLGNRDGDEKSMSIEKCDRFEELILSGCTLFPKGLITDHLRILHIENYQQCSGTDDPRFYFGEPCKSFQSLRTLKLGERYNTPISLLGERYPGQLKDLKRFDNLKKIEFYFVEGSKKVKKRELDGIERLFPDEVEGKLVLLEREGIGKQSTRGKWFKYVDRDKEAKQVVVTKSKNELIEELKKFNGGVEEERRFNFMPWTPVSNVGGSNITNSTTATTSTTADTWNWDQNPSSGNYDGQSFWFDFDSNN